MRFNVKQLLIFLWLVPALLLAQGQPPVGASSSTVVSAGELYETDGDGANTITVTTAGTYYGWTTAVAGILDNMTADVADAAGANLVVLVGGAGVYTLHIQADFSGTNGAVIKCRIFDTGVSTNIGFTRKIGTGGDVGSANALGYYDAEDGDEFSLRCTSDGSGDILNVWDFRLVAARRR